MCVRPEVMLYHLWLEGSQAYVLHMEYLSAAVYMYACVVMCVCCVFNGTPNRLSM